MIDLNIIEHMKTLTGSNTTFSKDNVSQKDFYSILIKHQLNMIDAWNPKKSDSFTGCLLYTSPSPRDATLSRMPSSA